MNPSHYEWIALLVIVLIGSSQSNFTVYRVTPTDEAQVRRLLDLHHNDEEHQFDFWKGPTHSGAQVHVMVSDDTRDKFLSILQAANISFEIMIDDVEKKIVEQKKKSDQWKNETWLRDSIYQGITFNLAHYHSFNDMIRYLNALAERYPDRVQLMTIGNTHEGRQIPLIKVGRPARSTKPAVWIDAGIHAREWIAPAVALYVIHQLVEKEDNDPTIRKFVDNLDFYIVPLLNPDGYEYSRSSSNPEVRLWRKNMSPRVCKQVRHGHSRQIRTKCCRGVDLNRNYDWDFGGEGSSTDPCSEIYQGSHGFSEPETRAVRDFVLARRGQIQTFITLHSYSQILMYPFGHKLRTYSRDVNELRNTALQAAGALRSLYGTQYQVGTGADTLYPASGGAEDWAKGRAGVKYSYLFELRPEEQVWDGFLLAENQILPTSRETFEAIKSIAARTLQAFGRVATRSKTFDGGICEDKDRYCKYWKSLGACDTHIAMLERCPKSCNQCTDTDGFLKRSRSRSRSRSRTRSSKQ